MKFKEMLENLGHHIKACDQVVETNLYLVNA